MLVGRKKEQIKLLHRRQLILRIILNGWTVITLALFVVDFLSRHRFDVAASSVGIFYIALLGIYAGDKEYSRWRTHFVSRFLGEGFVVIWTAVTIFFVITSTLSGGYYLVPEQYVLVYTSVVGIFALTQHSKYLKKERN